MLLWFTMIYISLSLSMQSWRAIFCILLPGAWASALWQAGADQGRQGREQQKHCDRQRRGQMPEAGMPVGRGSEPSIVVVYCHESFIRKDWLYMTIDLASNPPHLDCYFKFSLWVMSTSKIGEALRPDYFLQMTRDRVTSALGSIIENPSDIQAGRCWKHIFFPRLQASIGMVENQTSKQRSKGTTSVEALLAGFLYAQGALELTERMSR